MRRSHNSVVRPCAGGTRGSLVNVAPVGPEPRFSREITRLLLNLARARALAGSDPEAVARQLADWIGQDE